MKLTVNGIERELAGPPLGTLLDALRDELGITSPKAGCQQGGCGACTVLVDGEPRRSCLTPLVAVDGSSVTTVEALGEPGNLSPVQAAFYEQYGLQCGFCTPGFILAATALLERNASPSTEVILDELAGHFCRCTGYVKIVAAVEAAARGEVSDVALHAGATGPSRAEPEVLVPGSPA
jgi:aerobic-type carbon monoxide dehydrogenase small subunit (CoxS/CutS family)